MFHFLAKNSVFAAVSSLALLGATKGPLDQNPKSLVKVSILAGSTAAAPGKAVTIAMKFTIAKDWHIYWLNPGDAGMATAPSLKAPEGWTVSPWRFPVPKRFEQAGGVEGFGYTDEVVLLADVTPPVGFKGAATIEATTVFLVCESVCLPGKDVQTFTLQAGESEPANEDVIGVWERKMPVGYQGVVQATGTLGKTWSDFEVRLMPEQGWGVGDATAMEVFPLPTEDVELRGIKAKASPASAGGVTAAGTIRFQGKMYGGAKVVPPSISLLVVVTGAEGSRRGIWVDVPTGVASPTTMPSAQPPARAGAAEEK